MREDVEEAFAFGATIVSVTYLMSMFALMLWQSMDAVGVVVIGMGGITILVAASCEMNDMPLFEEE